MQNKKYRKMIMCLVFTFAGIAQYISSEAFAVEVGKWKRFELSFTNNNWSGNKWDLEFKGNFTSPSDQQLTQWGFYAGQIGGNDTWKIYFMPDEIGTWTFETQSTDPDLDGKTGSFNCIESRLEGQLLQNGNRWKMKDGGPDFPNIFSSRLVVEGSAQPRWLFRSEPASATTIIDYLDTVKNEVGVRLTGDFSAIAIRKTGWAASFPDEAFPYVYGQEGDDFNLIFWNRLNEKLDMARDRGIGFYLMVYSDDEMRPNLFGVTPQSTKEIRLFRYIIARLACYPIILWDSGIDIGEYRSNSWIDWFADWFLANDPWQHPVSSRTGGGSGGKFPTNATYYSEGGRGDGTNDIPSRSDLLAIFNDRSVPTVLTDHYRPFISRGNWDNDSIRRLLWRCLLTGGIGSYPDYLQGADADIDVGVIEQGREFIYNAVTFFKNTIGDFDRLAFHDGLIVSGDDAICSADPGKEYIVYDKNGGDITIDLSDASGHLNAYWYNPRTGITTSAGTVSGAGDREFTSPTSGTNNDWVLYITKSCDPTNTNFSDLNYDGITNSEDLSALIYYWVDYLCSGPFWCWCTDFNKSGSVDFNDFAELAANWLVVWNQPPVVNITDPHDGASIALPYEIVADASDADGSVETVAFFADAGYISEDNDGADGWTTTWQDYPFGQYILTAKATDNDGVTTTSPAVQIEVVTPPP